MPLNPEMIEFVGQLTGKAFAAGFEIDRLRQTAKLRLRIGRIDQRSVIRLGRCRHDCGVSPAQYRHVSRRQHLDRRMVRLHRRRG